MNDEELVVQLERTLRGEVEIREIPWGRIQNEPMDGVEQWFVKDTKLFIVIRRSANGRRSR